MVDGAGQWLTAGINDGDRTGELTINGYVILSEAGIFTDDAPDDPAFLFLLTLHAPDQISDNLTMPPVIGPFQGVHELGRLIGSQFLGLTEGAPHESFYNRDLLFTYTLEGAPGTFVGHVEVIPEPATLAMLLSTACLSLGLLLLRRRQKA